MVALAFLITFFSFPLITFLPVFAREVLHGSANTFTTLLCLSGVGSVCGALIIAGTKQQGLAKRSLSTMFLLGTVMFAFGASRSLFLSSVLVMLAGASLMIVFAMGPEAGIAKRSGTERETGTGT